MAFTLIDTKTGRCGESFAKTRVLRKGPELAFVQERKKGVPPQDIPAAITDPLVERVLGLR